MLIIEPKLPGKFSEITARFDKKTRLDDYPANAYKYAELDKYSKKEVHEIAEDVLDKSRLSLETAQDKLWASKKYGVLIVLQGMDTAGKDGTIRHVMSGVNPQGCRVQCFKTPTTEEHAHDFLWRYGKVLPERGEIVIFNRSHYEDVLAVKVHPEYMEALPKELVDDCSPEFWQNRYQDISAWERHLARNGVLVLKFFLHISKNEQKRRLLERIDIEEKNWKISPADLKERTFWDQYTTAFEDAITNTSRMFAPWIIVPANDKKIARAIVADVIAKAIDNLDIEYPEVSQAQKDSLQEARRQLESEQ
ncbi:MAG: PPK2 family polyphosphate kinase [Bacillota bacterium]